MKPWLLEYGCKCEGLPSPKHLSVHWKDCWSWNSNTLATWCEELTHWKRPWCWERLKAGREGDDRGWDGWMASPTQWIWVWVNSRSWWWTGRPGVLQSMGLQRIWHDWVAELNWTEDGCTLGFPGGSDGKESACNAGDPGSILGKILGNPREWQSTPIFLPGEFHGQRSLVGYSPWGCKELDMTEYAHTHRRDEWWLTTGEGGRVPIF